MVLAGLGVPIIGVGGITNLQDALEFFELGATAIAVGTGNFVNPRTMIEIIEGLEKFMLTNQFKNMIELRDFLRQK